ncbi:hypothetical protein [Rhodoblastus sp.]|uniref:hypothetical protein n=1 Tax=Rhodoblastus sp. TaxID=1962975 RepID=UPI003F9BD03F
MHIGIKSSSFAALSFALLSSGIAYAASPISGFGPTVSGDKSLNENLGVLTQIVAWQNSPLGDVYQLALATPAPEMPFENVAMETGTQDALPTGPQIRNDRTLNGNLQHLATVIAWQKSPEGDAFQYALEEHLKAPDFKQVALASIPTGGFDRRR